MMSSSKLLMLINFFPPAGGGGVYRPLSFVKYLSRMGWDITVVTPRPGEFWISDPSLEEQVPDEVRVVRTGSLSAGRILGMVRRRGRDRIAGTRSSGGFEFLRRAGEFFLLPDTYTGWRPFAVREASRLCRRERFDALYSTSPPDSTHLAALAISKRFNIPWLADMRDPWISLYLRDPVTPAHRFILERMERRVARGADMVAVTTKWQVETMSRLDPSCRVIRIPNGYDEEDFERPGSEVPDGPMQLTHCGMLTLGRRSHTFLEGLSNFLSIVPEAKGKVKVSFIGARESANEDRTIMSGLEGIVTFEDNLPHAECIERERSSHVLLLIKHDDARYEGLVPGKLYEYIGARRPILALAPDGEAADIVSGLSRGEVARIGDAEGVATALGKLFSAYSEGKLDSSYDLSPMPELSRRAAAENLSRQLQIISSNGVGGR
jgi:glycosyltransferase involved in cell wall biosynthesis